MSRWATVLKSRMETGEPYIIYKNNVNKDNTKQQIIEAIQNKIKKD